MSAGHAATNRAGALQTTRNRAPLSVMAAFPLAALVSFVSLVGILAPGFYARETVDWRGQALGQDWVDLLITVPWLITAGIFAARGSRNGSLLLAAGLGYTFYEFVIYGFALHFNALFLAYCAVLAVCFLALAGLGVRYVGNVRAGAGASNPPLAKVRLAGATLLAVGVSFALLWLAEVVPALLSGVIPASVVTAGTPTNPVQVLDLSVVLPGHLLVGASLLQRRPLGLVLAPMVLGFDVLMASSLAGMMWVMKQRGLEASYAVALAMLGLAALCGLALVRLLRGIPAP